MKRRWKLRLVEQDGSGQHDDMDMAWLQRAAIGMEYQQPSVTVELVCDGEVVLAFHSPSKRSALGEIYSVMLVDGQSPLAVFEQDLRKNGLDWPDT